ncbi:hydroxymethylpyrimidine/phosphomethylpyrimidine kinase Thi20p [[Candida] railenensis]|uniref:Hydroxymethylpyrimidine/phosphomethylpyrimidine kinase Thi20p n=1 Tax=[Candida] railenensis TaxID=45579 RepID=A0A9P0VZN1_9ASCO|nr:hydroxymethylpyrimidine/phosphomethylpyrimidine kinase Thi20p [[Candida] railenensis]
MKQRVHLSVEMTEKFSLRDVENQVLVKLPVVLSIAGSDPSGGAGIEADLKTLTAHKVFGTTCITAVISQNTQQLLTIDRTSESQIRNILKLVFDDFVEGSNKTLKVIKTGMLSGESIKVLVSHLDYLKSNGIKLVVDPVMVTTTGASLIGESDLQGEDRVAKVIRHAAIVTPNHVEALALYKMGNNGIAYQPKIEVFEDLLKFVKSLQRVLQCENLLVKGGHMPWNKLSNTPYEPKNSTHNEQVVIRDILYQSNLDKITVYESSFKKTENTHGTGCTLSSSIAANLAKGFPIEEAVPLSIDFVHKSMGSMEKLGYGNGPLNHITEPETNIATVIKEEEQNAEITMKTDFSALEYFKTHPKVADKWKRYVQHPFLSQVATNSLEYDKFLYFLKQDYYYLVNYAQIQCLAAAVAPTYQITFLESSIVKEIVQEIEKHKEKLSQKYNVDYDKDTGSTIRPGRACIAYCNYLLGIGKKEDYLGIKTAVAPCLFGYHEAGLFAKSIREEYERKGLGLGVLTSAEDSDAYASWIEDYISEWYTAAYNNGSDALDLQLKGKPITKSRLNELINIFATVTDLEIAFWDEVLEV